jgi:hypothetical protein
VAHGRLQTVDGQQDGALLAEGGGQPLAVGGGEGAEFVGAAFGGWGRCVRPGQRFAG